MKKAFLLLLLFLLSACTPGPLAGAAGVGAATDAASTETNSLDPATETPLPGPTLTFTPEPTFTFTPEPSPTPTPAMNIQDLDTWPQDMRDYFYGRETAWTDPQRTTAFDAFLLQLRRGLLIRSGVADAQGLSNEQVFNEYLKWGTFHPQELLTFSPSELRSMLVDSLHRDTAVISYQDNGLIQNGIYADYFPTGPVSLADYKKYVSTTEARLSGLQNTISLNVLGSQVSTLLPSYYGAYGELIARFRLPVEVDPASAQGILVHFFLEGKHTYLPLILHYDYWLYPSESNVVTTREYLIIYSGDDTIFPVRSSMQREENDATSLGEADIQAMIGSRVHFRWENSLTSGYSPAMLFPFALGIPNTSIITSVEETLRFTDPTIFPWSTQP